MSGIAEILLSLGYSVTGSDVRLTPITERLSQLGAKIYEGHAAQNINGARVLVVTSALDESNPEVAEAKRRGIPVIPRGELLAELMRLKFGIAVAGSHGKTTTTSMIAAVLSHAGLDPTVVVGGRVGTMGGTNARLGKTTLMVVESDESDGSFLKLSPVMAIVTNIDREHLDHYKDIDEIRDAFTDFVNKIPFYGVAVVCLDDENVQQILPRIRRRVVTYGQNRQADLYVSGAVCGHLSSEFRVEMRGRDLGQFRVNVPGIHNVLNAAAVIGIALELEIDPAAIREGLASFRGVDRRFQFKGEERGVTVIDDYGHHPTEVRATLAAARQCHFNRIHVIFQPHRYTRTLHLMDEFARSFNDADDLYLLDVYAASEKPIEGVSSQALADRLRSYGHRSVVYSGSIDQVIEDVRKVARQGDVVLTLGAGNVWQAGDRLLEALRHAA